MPRKKTAKGGAMPRMGTEEREFFLKEAVDEGIIDDTAIVEALMAAKKKKYLAMHEAEIWQNKRGLYCTYLPGRVRVTRKKREDLEEVLVEFYSSGEVNPTIHEVFHEWNDRRREIGALSEAAHTRYREIYCRHFGVFGRKQIRTLSAMDFTNFLENEFYGKELSSKSFSNLKLITRGILKSARKRKLIRWTISDVFDDLDISKKDYKIVVKTDEEVVFSDEQVDAIMDHLLGSWTTMHQAIFLLFITGCRIGEIVALSAEDIHEGSVVIRKTETRFRKPDKEGGGYAYRVKDSPKTKNGFREVAIPPQFNWFLEELKANAMKNKGNWLFVSRTGRRYHTDSIRKSFYRVLDVVGRKRFGEPIPSRGLHCIRKTYASRLVDAGAPATMVKNQLGHASFSITENFYLRSRYDTAAKQQLLADVFKEKKEKD